jgi:GT2 family glycosyltransferase
MGGFDEDFNPGCYDDDAICFSIRRRGYKVIFAKDAFVHHYGARSFNEEYDKDPSLQTRNRNLFISKFVADPYVAGLINYDVLKILTYSGTEDVDILGIGNSYGMTVLQLKNFCKLNGSKNIGLYYLTE